MPDLTPHPDAMKVYREANDSQLRAWKLQYEHDKRTAKTPAKEKFCADRIKLLDWLLKNRR